MEFPNYVPLLNSNRSNYIDNVFFGLVYLCGSNGVIKKIGDGFNIKFFLRSMFKPIQASIISEFENLFSDKELAIMQGSHSGTKNHVEIVKLILDKFNLKENDLLCPIILPLDKREYDKNTKYTKLHNKCSGKHAMMLAYSKLKGYDISNYTDFSHPVQLEIKKTLLNYAKTSSCIKSKDGCTAPIYALEMEDISRAFLNYYNDKKNQKLINAYKNNPSTIGGFDEFGKRLDTKIMELSSNLVSKVGAGGFVYVYNLELNQILIVKMAQNNNPEREIVTLEILYKLNWLDKRYYDENIYLQDKSVIGKYSFPFEF